MPAYAPPNSHYAHLDVSQYGDDVLLRAIGREGWMFKRLTNKLGLIYLWWDKEAKRVEIWGPFESLKKGAKDHVQQHIVWHSQPWISAFHDD